MKTPLTPAGIEPATFRFVAQHLNHCATAVPSLRVVMRDTIAYPTQQSTSPSRGIPCSHKRGNYDQVTAV